MSVFDETLDVLFAEFGTPGVYTPPGSGAGIACTVVLDRRDPDQNPEDGRPRTGTMTVEVRKSDVAAPASRGSFLVDARTYRIQSRPFPADADGLVWRMWVQPQ